MKNIGILTACRTNNIGTDLQTLAMQQLFSHYYKTEIINYKCEKLEGSHRILPRLKLSDIYRIPYRIYKNWSHSNFRRHFIHFSTQIYDKYTIHKVKGKYDAVVVGSDQIWNLNITGGDINFFLPWNDSPEKKVSYAPSLGSDNISKWEEEYNISLYLKKFNKVTVREASGVIALRNIGIDSKEILDPLLAVDPELWKSFRMSIKDKPYLLLYQVGTSIEEVTLAIEYAHSKGWDVICIKPPSMPVKGVTTRSFVSIEQWIGYIQNAEMVVTDSYHGLSMCVSTHTNFRLVLMPLYQNNLRSINLIKNIGCIDFILGQKDMMSVPNWDCVEHILTEKRIEAHKYIQSIIG